MAKTQIPNNFEADDDFDQEILSNNVIDRDYAKTGNILGDNAPVETQKPQIERVNFDFSRLSNEEIEVEEEVIDEDGDLLENHTETQIEHNDGLDPEQVALNKKVQNKIAKSQSKNIINVYCFILIQSIRWSTTINEEKLYAAESRNEIDLSAVIGNLPLIQHIKNGNEAIRNIVVDEDSREAMQEALEIYMTSMNIQTSPGVNLAIAMGTPAITLFMDAFQQKRSMKTLISAQMETHALAVKKNKALENQVSQEAARNAELMRELEAMRRQMELNSNQTPVPKYKEPTKTPAPKAKSKAEQRVSTVNNPVISNTGETPAPQKSNKQKLIEQNS